MVLWWFERALSHKVVELVAMMCLLFFERSVGELVSPPASPKK